MHREASQPNYDQSTLTQARSNKPEYGKQIRIKSKQLGKSQNTNDSLGSKKITNVASKELASR